MFSFFAANLLLLPDPVVATLNYVTRQRGEQFLSIYRSPQLC